MLLGKHFTFNRVDLRGLKLSGLRSLTLRRVRLARGPQGRLNDESLQRHFSTICMYYNVLYVISIIYIYYRYVLICKCIVSSYMMIYLW